MMNSTTHRPITLVAALARNGVIGRDNALPWHLPEDLKRFKRLTMGHAVLMGRKTFDSITAVLGKPLPGRTSLVMTRNPEALALAPEWRDVIAVSSVDEALARAPGTDEIDVIGGAQIYALLLPRATRMHLTEIKTEVEGDARFPEWNRGRWRESGREPGPAAPGGPAYDFVTYDRLG